MKVLDYFSSYIVLFEGFLHKKWFWPAEFKFVGIFELSLSVIELEANTFSIF
jgi:hypothetical protein